ncbi:hypothetical protein [Acaryochloris sp. IP29b_bin.137]|uniref:hypothetical protein n=1 Tax=Acaryochloris sp. IP29b_bin.137 TaxID=2969217 RepID=UPI002615066A|nr:hypothetical protein [Acaryochloris sp. IP29b_bin.137]
MGEAKRRKQILGRTYGQESFIRIKGDRQFEDHFQKFCQAWEQKLKEISHSNDSETELSEAKIQENDQTFQAWLTQYLQDYRPQDRERLVGGLLDFLYAEMEKLDNEEDSEKLQQKVSNWVLEAITLFTLLKPHLTDQQQRDYAHPLLELYEIMLNEVKDEMDEAQQEEARASLAEMFAVCLDIPAVEE